LDVCRKAHRFERTAVSFIVDLLSAASVRFVHNLTFTIMLTNDRFVPTTPCSRLATADQSQSLKSAIMDIRFWQNLPKDTFKRIFSKGPQPGASSGSSSIFESSEPLRSRYCGGRGGDVTTARCPLPAARCPLADRQAQGCASRPAAKSRASAIKAWKAAEELRRLE
jgi:hypothetical protein